MCSVEVIQVTAFIGYFLLRKGVKKRLLFRGGSLPNKFQSFFEDNIGQYFRFSMSYPESPREGKKIWSFNSSYYVTFSACQ